MESVSPPSPPQPLLSESSEEAPQDVVLLTCEAVQLETQPMDRSRGLIPGNLRVILRGGTQHLLQWAPTVETSKEYHVEFPLRRIVTLRRNNGPRASFILTKGESVGPFSFRSQADYDRLLNTFAELKVIDTDALSRSYNLGDWLSGFAGLYGVVKKQLADLTHDDSVQNRVTYMPSDEETHQTVHRERSSDPNSPVDVVCRRTEDMGEMGDFEVFDMANSLPKRRPCKREEPVSLKEWESFFRNGVLVKEVALRRRVFKGGLAPDVRARGWKFFLGFKGDDADFVRSATEQYTTLKRQWSTLLPEQLANNKQMREQQSIIEKDVYRTDRVHPLFTDRDGEGLKALSNVLTTWLVYNWDLGYVQGMSDLAAMLYVVLQDEVATFWCFVHWMERLSTNFDQTQTGIVSQLALLARLIKYIDPELMTHLEEQRSEHLFFCFRWLIVLFKREFSYDDAMTIWEAIWTEYLSADFPLFICAAIILSARDRILSEKMAYDDILKTFNDMAMNMEAKQVLCDAESIFHQVHACADKDLPPSLRPLRQTWTERYDVSGSQGRDEDEEEEG